MKRISLIALITLCFSAHLAQGVACKLQTLRLWQTKRPPAMIIPGKKPNVSPLSAMYPVKNGKIYPAPPPGGPAVGLYEPGTYVDIPIKGDCQPIKINNQKISLPIPALQGQKEITLMYKGDKTLKNQFRAGLYGQAKKTITCKNGKTSEYIFMPKTPGNDPQPHNPCKVCPIARAFCKDKGGIKPGVWPYTQCKQCAETS